MPLYIRKLPAGVAMIVDEKNIPKHISLFNPSKAGPYTYIRQTEHTNAGDSSSIIIHNDITKQISNIESPYYLLPKTVNLFKGLEDLRLCIYENKLWFAATCTHASESMNNELVIGFFNKEVSKIEKLQMINIGTVPVKNVILFVHDQKLLLLDIYLQKIYSVIEDIETKVWSIETYKDLVPAAGISTEKYRGSSQPIHLHGSTYGCIVHDIIFNDNTKLVTRLSYLHHWYEFNIDTGFVTFISSPFWIAHWGIEYVSGIYKEEQNNKIEIYLGVNDKYPFKAVTTLSDLRIGK